MARKLNVQAEITTVKTKYLTYAKLGKAVIEIITESVPEFKAMSDREKLEAVRKYDLYACDVIGQEIERKVKYAMTEDTFAKIAYEIPDNKRHGLLTRRKKQFIAVYSSFDTVKHEFKPENEMVIPVDVYRKGNEKIVDYLRKEVETESFHVLALVKTQEKDGKLYGVSREMFKLNAVRLTKEESEEIENVDEMVEENEH